MVALVIWGIGEKRGGLRASSLCSEGIGGVGGLRVIAGLHVLLERVAVAALTLVGVARRKPTVRG